MVFLPWGNLFKEKVSPNPFQNLFNLWLPVCVADMMERGFFEIFRGVRFKSVRPVDMGLVLISTKIVKWKSGAAETLISLAILRLRDTVRHDRIQLHFIGFPRVLANPPSALYVCSVG